MGGEGEGKVRTVCDRSVLLLLLFRVSSPDVLCKYELTGDFIGVELSPLPSEVYERDCIPPAP